MTDLFETAFRIVVGEEGGYTRDTRDPGNWTGGAVGAGTVRGTKFGISAAAFPQLDIAALDLGQARDIYRRRYWDAVRAALMPPALAVVMFDTAVLMGTSGAIRVLQQALGVAEDGIWGDQTSLALELHLGSGRAGADHPLSALCARVLSIRLMRQSELQTWTVFGQGWIFRVTALPWRMQDAGIDLLDMTPCGA